MIGGGALAIWFGIDPAVREELEAWYPRQHLPERLSVPGFLRGRRYAALGDGPTFFTLYETRDAGVLSSAAYLERLNNPTDWTRRVLPGFREMVRNVYGLLGASAPDAVARHLLTVRVKPDSGRGPTVRRWLEGEAIPALTALGTVTGCALYVSETSGTSVVTEERRLVGEVTGATPFLALCEVADAAAEPALREFWQARGRKLAAETTVDLYRLMYGLSWI